MCGRFAQYRKPHRYAQALGLGVDQLALIQDQPAAERYNIAPTSQVHVLHMPQGLLQDDVVPWGWSPAWAKGKRPAPINARIEGVATSPFFRPIWRHGRAIVGADGWYEWKKDPANPKVKQPYFIRLKSGDPLLFAALGELPDGIDPPNRGVVIITGGADSGLVDVHDRKPLVLPPDFARTWLNPDTSPEEAQHIAEQLALPAEAFEWYLVDKAVGNVRNQGPQLIEPISDPLL